MAEVRYSFISGFPGYRIGDDGSGWTCWRFRGGGYAGQPEWYISDPPRWKRLKPDVRKSDGRQRYTLRNPQGGYKKIQVSHLVLLHFVGPQPDGMEGCHNDGDCSNNHWDNLRWDTPAANKADMKRHGTNCAGERSGMAKLTWERVRAIRKRFAAGNVRKTQIARDEGVTPTLIGYIIAEKIWKEQDGNARLAAVSDSTSH
jgi:hypothetical protein